MACLKQHCDILKICSLVCSSVKGVDENTQAVYHTMLLKQDIIQFHVNPLYSYIRENK